MTGKNYKSNIHPILVGILSLSIILAYSSSPFAQIHSENQARALRAASTGNGNASPLVFYSESKPSDVPDSFLEVDRNASQVTIVPRGVVAVTVTEADGRKVTVFVGGGTEFDLRKGVIENISEAHAEAIKATPEYTGTDIDAVEGQTKALHMTTQEIYDKLPRLTRPKKILDDVDGLPDFEADKEGPERELAKAIIRAKLSRMLEYRQDQRFDNMGANKVYIGFISGSNDNKKVEKVMRLIKEQMPDIKENALKLIEGAPAEMRPSNLIIITYEGSSIAYNPQYKGYYTILVEKKVITDGRKIAAYPWNGIMDAALAAVSADRDNLQDSVVDFLKELFENMLKKKLDRKVILDFLSKEVTVSRAAAIDLVLPPIKEIDLKEVGEVIRIITEVAKYA